MTTFGFAATMFSSGVGRFQVALLEHHRSIRLPLHDSSLVDNVQTFVNFGSMLTVALFSRTVFCTGHPGMQAAVIRPRPYVDF